MAEPLLPARFLFAFMAPCQRKEPLWTKDGAKLDESYRLLSLGALEGRPALADVRAAWSPTGIVVAVHVSGKKQPPWCRATRPEDSDCLQLWIDTRDVHNVHRAGRFCHRFIFLPSGDGPQLDEPLAGMLPIHRAREQPRPVASSQLAVRSKIGKDGYMLECHIPAAALTGFDPDEYPRLGFTYALVDRELGEQTFSVGSPMPYQEDPSLWGTLELVNQP